jgi:small subunit ribosomal protein S8
MSLNDPISDLLTRLRNARQAKHRFVDLRVSKLKLNLIKVLKEQGFIENFIINDDKGMVRIFMKYAEGREPVLQGLKRISSPGMRQYVGYKQIPKILGGMGIAIVSTPKGLLDGESARQLKMGGELLCLVW